MVFSVAFSNNDSKIVSGSSNGIICVWDASTGTNIFTTLHPIASIRSVVFSDGDSKIVSSSHNNTIRVWDASTGTEIIPSQPITHEDAGIINRPQTRLISVNKNGWVTDIATGRHTKLPTGLNLSYIEAHNSMLAAWSRGRGLVLIEFPPLCRLSIFGSMGQV